MGILLTISTVIGLIRKHIGTAEQFVALAREGVAIVQRDDLSPIPADQVETEIAEALAQAAATGDHAAARIEDRHAADGTGQP